MRSCHLSFVQTKNTSPLWNLNGYLFFGIHWSYLRSMFERTDEHFKSQLKIICSHGCISKRVMARCYIIIFPHTHFSPLIFPGEKLVYTHFSGGKMSRGKNECVTPAITVWYFTYVKKTDPYARWSHGGYPRTTVFVISFQYIFTSDFFKLVYLSFKVSFINSKISNVHPPNRFAGKEGIWYDYLCPITKKNLNDANDVTARDF